jgi:hypothetical protein
VTISRVGDHFAFTSTQGDKSLGPEKDAPEQTGEVGGAKVSALIAALQENVMPSPGVSNLGITSEWLKQHVGDDFQNEILKGAPNQQALFRDTFTDLHFVQDHLSEILSSFHTDDYPFVSVRITFAQGVPLAACASGQHAFMLPWVVSGSCAHFDSDAGPRTVSYNANISRALAAVLPSGATNRPRLNGEGLIWDLSEYAWYSIRGSWNLLDVENKAPGALTRLKTRYSVADAELNDFDSSLHVTLASDLLPTNVRYALVLPYEGNKVVGVEEFLRRGEIYGKKLISVPWLDDFIRQHSDVPVWISYEHGASMADQSLRAFLADMHKIGRDDLAEQVKLAGDDATHLIVGERFYGADWILMPDHRLLLWRFNENRPRSLLRWSPSNFGTRSCADFQPYYCVGAVISPSGELEKQ